MCLRQQINRKTPGYPEASCFQRQMFWPTDKLLRSGFVQHRLYASGHPPLGPAGTWAFGTGPRR